MRAKDSHRYDWRECFPNHQTQSRLGRLQVAVERARAFGENERRVPGLENTDQCLDSAPVHAFLIDWDHIQLWQKPAEQRHVQ